LARLFDHLVGAGEQCRRHGQTQRLRGLEVEYQLELGRLLHRQIGGFLALEETTGVLADQTERIRPVLSSISDPALRAVLQEAHAERLGIWVAVWPVSFLVMSQILEKKMQG